MAFGDTVGKIAGSFYETGSREAVRANLYGNLFDLGMSYVQNRRDQQAAANDRYIQEQLVQKQAQLASQKAAEETQLRQRTLDRAAALDLELKTAAAKLGPRVGVNPGDIAQNYQTFHAQIMDDYNRTLDRINSQGYADMIARGMDRSTADLDRRAELARSAADALPGLQQAAFDAAINRSTSYADALNYGRDDAMREISDRTNAVTNIESGLLTNQAGTMMANATNARGNLFDASNRQAADSQSFLGNALGRFNEKIAPNIGYAFGAEGSEFTDTSQSDAERDLAAYRRVYGPLNNSEE